MLPQPIKSELQPIRVRLLRSGTNPSTDCNALSLCSHLFPCFPLDALERPGAWSARCFSSEIGAVASERSNDVLSSGAMSRKSRQSQESVQVGPLHSRRTGARGVDAKRTGKWPEHVRHTAGNGSRSPPDGFAKGCGAIARQEVNGSERCGSRNAQGPDCSGPCVLAVFASLTSEEIPPRGLEPLSLP